MVFNVFYMTVLTNIFFIHLTFLKEKYDSFGFYQNKRLEVLLCFIKEKVKISFFRTLLKMVRGRLCYDMIWKWLTILDHSETLAAHMRCYLCNLKERQQRRKGTNKWSHRQNFTQDLAGGWGRQEEICGTYPVIWGVLFVPFLLDFF